MTEIDYAEYVSDGSGDEILIAASASITDWAGLSIAVTAQSTPYQVEMFIPVVQSTNENSLVFFQLVEGSSTQVGLISCQSLPNDIDQHEQTHGPLIYTRRFPAFTGSTKTYKVR